MTEETTQENPGLSLQDLAMTLLIIDTVSQRGAIKGEEMADVGALRNRIKAFLDYQNAQNQPPEEDSEATEEASE